MQRVHKYDTRFLILIFNTGDSRSAYTLCMRTSFYLCAGYRPLLNDKTAKFSNNYKIMIDLLVNVQLENLKTMLIVR